MTSANVKGNFSQVMKDVRKGEEIIVSFGKQKEDIAVIIPIQSFKKAKKRKLGILNKKVEYAISENWKMTDDDFLRS